MKLISQTDTLICDNGGFEDDFDYYFGAVGTFDYGSNSCTPTYMGSPSTWSSASLPSFRRFAIVSSGVDTLVGINRTKFGSKSLLLNHRYGHNTRSCYHTDRDMNKIIKRFKVTEENRDFTVWYAVVLEYPNSHTNTQPWFGIKCDRAPSSDLCFDATILKNCGNLYTDSLCIFDTIKCVGLDMS